MTDSEDKRPNLKGDFYHRPLRQAEMCGGIMDGIIVCIEVRPAPKGKRDCVTFLARGVTEDQVHVYEARKKGEYKGKADCAYDFSFIERHPGTLNAKRLAAEADNEDVKEA